MRCESQGVENHVLKEMYSEVELTFCCLLSLDFSSLTLPLCECICNVWMPLYVSVLCAVCFTLLPSASAIILARFSCFQSIFGKWCCFVFWRHWLLCEVIQNVFVDTLSAQYVVCVFSCRKTLSVLIDIIRFLVKFIDISRWYCRSHTHTHSHTHEQKNGLSFD